MQKDYRRTFAGNQIVDLDAVNISETALYAAVALSSGGPERYGEQSKSNEHKTTENSRGTPIHPMYLMLSP